LVFRARPPESAVHQNRCQIGPFGVPGAPARICRTPKSVPNRC